MLLLGMQKKISGECGRGLKSQLRELEWESWLAGNPAVLYCTACETTVSSEKVAEGPIADWPYCPIHRKRPLIIRSAFRPVGMHQQRVQRRAC